MFIDVPNAHGDNRFFDTPLIGQKAVRRCGNYFEYCDGACNSCPKGQCTASDHTVLTYQTTTDKTEFVPGSTTYYQKQYLMNKIREAYPSSVDEFEFSYPTLE